MAKIGTFKKQNDGRFTGTINTLTIRAAVELVPVERQEGNGPDFRAWAKGAEIGAAWMQESKAGPTSQSSSTTRAAKERAGGHHYALRLAVATMLASTANWSVRADTTAPMRETTADSVASGKAAKELAEARKEAAELLSISLAEGERLTDRRASSETDTARLFAALLPLEEEQVLDILTVIVAETLPVGSGLAEALGVRLNLEMSRYWQPDDAFLDLVRDKRLLGSMLAEIGGKTVADGNRNATAPVLKGIIRDFLQGTNSREKASGWMPRWFATPMQSYTDRGGMRALTAWNRIRDRFAG